MNTISYRLGFWSALLITVAFIAWILCFVGITATSPLFYWTNLHDYLSYVSENGRFFQTLAQFFMLLVGPLFVLLINSFYELADQNKKVYARAALLFALAFAVLSSLHYFVQLSSVRINIEHGQTSGLEHFVQANPNSIMTALDMTGWTLFLGLSSFLIFPVISGKGVYRLIRYAFLSNGISCFFAGIGYVLQIDVLTFIFINLGVGGAILIISISSMLLFTKLRKAA